MNEENEIIPPPSEIGRTAKGRFTYGNPGGPGNTTTRIDVPRGMRRYCRNLGLDVEVLMAEVALAMLYQGACGDTAAARLAHDMLGMKEPSGPLVAVGIGLGAGVPQPPALVAGVDGSPPLSEHLERLVAIAQERGLVDLKGQHPAKMVKAIAEKHAAEKKAEEDLLA